MYRDPRQVLLKRLDMTPNESHMKIWFTRWQDIRSVEDSCTLYLVSVEEMASTSFLTSGRR
jgi:hypothetical protein